MAPTTSTTTKPKPVVPSAAAKGAPTTTPNTVPYSTTPSGLPAAPGSTPSPTARDGFDPAAAASGATGLDARVAALRMALLTGGTPYQLGAALSQANTNASDTLLDDAGMPGGVPMSAQDQTAFNLWGGDAPASSNRTVGQLLGDLDTMSGDEFRRLQQSLYQAGMFQGNYYSDPESNPVAWGNRYDQATRYAYGQLLANGLADKGKSLQQILAEHADAYAKSGTLADGTKVRREGTVGGGNHYDVVLSDPAKVQAIADTAAEAVLGRGLTDEDKAKYVDLIHAKEGAQQGAINAGKEAQDRTNFATKNAEADANVESHNGSASFNVLVNNIIGEESSGTIDAVGKPVVVNGKTEVATGKYQVIGSTWNHYRGYAEARDAPEQVQDEFARNMLARYVNQFGEAGAAVAWAGGPQMAAQYVKNPSDPKWSTVMVGGNTSIAKYVATATGGTSGLSSGSAPSSTSYAADTYIDPSTTTTTGVDAQAELDKQIRADNPQEAGAHDMDVQYQHFRQAIGLSALGAA